MASSAGSLLFSPLWVLIGAVLILCSMISFLSEQKEALMYPQRELLQRSCEASFPGREARHRGSMGRKAKNRVWFGLERAANPLRDVGFPSEGASVVPLG